MIFYFQAHGRFKFFKNIDDIRSSTVSQGVQTDSNEKDADSDDSDNLGTCTLWNN